MIINRNKLDKAGFVIEDRDGDICIYPKESSGNSRVFTHFSEILEECGLSRRDSEMLADKFTGEATNAIIFNLFD